MRWTKRLFRTPPLIVSGERFTAWLGLVVSWAAAGFGGGASSRALGLLLSFDEGACGAHSASVCQVAGWGGLAMGMTAIAGGAAMWLFIARGFGPPVPWWVLAIVLLAVAFAPCATAEGTEVPKLWLVAAAVAATLALCLLVLAAARGKAARYGFIRLDGLDAREVAHRPVDKAVLPVAASLALALGVLCGAQVIRMLAEG